MSVYNIGHQIRRVNKGDSFTLTKAMATKLQTRLSDEFTICLKTFRHRRRPPLKRHLLLAGTGRPSPGVKKTFLVNDDAAK